jgi:hypothetical protein
MCGCGKRLAGGGGRGSRQDLVGGLVRCTPPHYIVLRVLRVLVHSLHTSFPNIDTIFLPSSFWPTTLENIINIQDHSNSDLSVRSVLLQYQIFGEQMDGAVDSFTHITLVVSLLFRYFILTFKSKPTVGFDRWMMRDKHTYCTYRYVLYLFWTVIRHSQRVRLSLRRSLAVTISFNMES